MGDENTKRGSESAGQYDKPGSSEKNSREDHLVEPDNALPEVTMEDIPEHMRKAAARAGPQPGHGSAPR